MKPPLHFTRRLSVRAKLMLAITGTACISLLLACGLFVAHELMTFRQSLITRVAVLADVLALDSAAPLDFDDRERAREILESMAAAPSIVAAGLYTSHGELFASYSHSGTPFEMPMPPTHGGPRFEHGRLLLFRPVIRDAQEIGTIGLVASSGELHERIVSYGIISAMVLTGCLGFAAVLGSLLQRRISKPVANLAATSTLISEGKDYSVRAAVETDDELGQLAVSFNHMLDRIQERETTLVLANSELRRQMDARVQAEQALKALNEELERRVEKRTAELRRSNSELEQFAYIASHDLKEPLRMVVSYLQLLDRRYKEKLDEQGREFLNFAVDGGLRMQALIMDLLAFSRVNTQKNPFTSVELNPLIESVVGDLKLAITEAGATITRGDLPTIKGDAAQLARLFQNLLGNSIKFRGKEPPRITVSARRDDHGWRFGVSDNGIGIEPQYFERIFVIFQRLHGRTEYPGTGIGLAVCKRIVERHGGRIWVESEPGKGTTFYFTIADHIPDDA
jgi:signal transduction histidine kinase